jgi:cell division protein ZapA (FtsZ GTPase activity inhibitor)
LGKIDKAPFSRLASGLGGRSRWFLTELVVIVAGILIALAIDEWRENNEGRKAESEYLHQLITDLRATEEKMEAAIANNAASENATTRLVGIFEGGETVEADSIGKSLDEMFYYNNPVPVLGAIAALVSTGDLVRPPELKLPTTCHKPLITTLSRCINSKTPIRKRTIGC